MKRLCLGCYSLALLVAWSASLSWAQATPAPAAAPAAGAPAGAAAKAKDAAPPIDKWLEEIKSKPSGFPKNLVVLTAMPEKGKGAPKFLSIDTKVFNALSFVQAVDVASADWDIKLNKSKYEAMDAFETVVQLTKAEMVISAPASGDWEVFDARGGKKTSIKKAPAAKGTTPQDIVTWLFTTLNWDGVVLEQKGDFLLVGAQAQAISSPQIQALAVDNSANKLLLTAAERKGAGLLSLSQAKGGVAVFDVVFLGQGVKALPAGTKLIIEKKK